MAAFAQPEPDRATVEVTLLDALRRSDAWMPQLSLVARPKESWSVTWCARGLTSTSIPVVALGPIGVLPDRQGNGIGAAMIHAVVAAADTLDEPLVGLLGSRELYDRFGFRPATGFRHRGARSELGRPLPGATTDAVLERSGRSVRVRAAVQRLVTDAG